MRDVDLKNTENNELLKLMHGSSRLKRKNAAKELSSRAKKQPDNFVDYIAEFIDALNRPEAQTRWECFNALTYLVALKPDLCKKALDSAEEALFDGRASLLRLAALRFICHYGALAVPKSKEAWPLIKEALSQFHGEIEFDEMLAFIIFFAKGKISQNIKAELNELANELIVGALPSTKFRLGKLLDALTNKPNTDSKKTKKATKKNKPKTNSSKKNTKKTTKKEALKKKAVKKVVKKAVEKKIEKAKPSTKKKKTKKNSKNSKKSK